MSKQDDREHALRNYAIVRYERLDTRGKRQIMCAQGCPQGLLSRHIGKLDTMIDGEIDNGPDTRLESARCAVTN